MSKNSQIARLITEGVVLERMADSISVGALRYHGKTTARDEQVLWRMARDHRVRALLARGKAAALYGREIGVDAPE